MMSVCLVRELARRLNEDANLYRLSDKFQQDAMMFMEFNICAADCDDIPLVAYFNRRALLATANCTAVRRMLRTPYQRRIMEQVIDDMALEHLGHIRYIEHWSGRFVDMWADDMEFVVEKKLK